MDKKKILVVVAIAGAVIIAGGVFFLFVVQPDIIRKSAEKANVSSGQATDTDSASPGYTITPIPLDDTIRSFLPDLSRGIAFSESVPEPARVALTEQARSLAAILNDDPTRADSWFNLAIVYHSANDYDGARMVWEFLTKVVQEDTTSYDNLGKLYHFSLRDYPKAESYFNQSIAVNPELLTPYLELFNLYRYSYKTDTTKAADIINKAMEKFPGDPDLHILLGDYYRDRGEYENARAAYLAAIDKARVANDIQRMNAIGDSLSKLPQ